MGIKFKGARGSFYFTPVSIVDEIREHTEYHGEDAVRDSCFDAGRDIQVLFEFCEALSCSNVAHEPIEKIDERVNQRRIKNGKLPLWETRHLVIDTKYEATEHKAGYAIIGRQGPRQHLRRGHIRRISGNRKIWINSCVVGHAEKGRIEKTYGVA